MVRIILIPAYVLFSICKILWAALRQTFSIEIIFIGIYASVRINDSSQLFPYIILIHDSFAIVCLGVVGIRTDFLNQVCHAVIIETGCISFLIPDYGTLSEVIVAVCFSAKLILQLQHPSCLIIGITDNISCHGLIACCA